MKIRCLDLVNEVFSQRFRFTGVSVYAEQLNDRYVDFGSRRKGRFRQIYLCKVARLQPIVCIESEFFTHPGGALGHRDEGIVMIEPWPPAKFKQEFRQCAKVPREPKQSYLML